MTAADIPTLASLYYHAFAPTALNRYLYSAVSVCSWETWFSERLRRIVHDREVAKKAVEVTVARRGDKVLGFAYAVLLDEARPDRHEQERTYPEGADLVRAKEYLAAVDRWIAGVQGTHWSFDILAIAPDEQGGGVGRRLTEVVLAKAAETGVKVALESTEYGKRLYERLGFRQSGPPLVAAADQSVQRTHLRTFVAPVHLSLPIIETMSSAHKREQFLSVWPDLSKELVDYCKGENMPQEAVEWFQRSLDYNTPGGKLNRGISVVDTVEIIKGSALTPDEYKKAAILGWCIELLQAYFLVADDMMDQSITRRGQPCWYRVENVGNIAINDAFMLEAAIYYLLKKHFRQEKYYVDLLELFHETTFQTELGQLIDLITAPEDHVDLSKFSLEKHHLIVVYKTAYYSFYLPVALALHMSGVQSPAAFQKALDILIPMGEYFQVQDDYLDCYGTPEQIGKIGTDILDNKCSWLINAALGKASAAQRKVLDENYGVKSSESEAKVKAVYRELELARLFEEYEAESYTRINGLINEIPEHGSDDGLQRAVFTEFLSKVYKRQKFVACPSRY
ncbi:hypothetical protein JCM21900_006334 [Sporobolomyces salmonicolor]